MELNADFSQRVVVHSDEVEWLASPMPGVDRRMLDRIGNEVARATTIVRYAPQSKFSAHTHTGGEEFIVLEGVFQDEHGDFPVGSYVRNPPTSSHTPGSEPGTTIFVKLWQFEPDDRTQIMINMDKTEPVPADGRPGVSIIPLYKDARETVRTEIWSKDADIDIDLPEGGEFLVLDGSFSDGQDTLRKHSWLRIPEGGSLKAKALTDKTRVWMKLRHIPHATPPAA
ncbi:MAG: cupin domain-containing protein [Paracoccaceae bacterium]